VSVVFVGCSWMGVDGGGQECGARKERIVFQGLAHIVQVGLEIGEVCFMHAGPEAQARCRDWCSRSSPGTRRCLKAAAPGVLEAVVVNPELVS